MEFIAPKNPQGYAQVEFIAYTTPSQKEGINGEVVTAGAETFVRYIHQIKIKEIQEGGRTGKADFGLAVVHFDPSSVGLNEAIRGNTLVDDPTFPILKEALEQDKPVDVAIEMSRRAKADKEPIEWFTPIQALRGSKEPGAKGTPEDSKKNTKSAIAMVNGVATNEIVSDPSFWHELEANKKGFFAPAGYKRVFDPENWAAYSYIVPDENSQPARGATEVALDLEALAEKISEKLGSDDSRTYYKKPAPHEIGEAAPYATHTRHGLPSLGHYTVQRERFTFAWAYSHIQETSESQTVPLETAWELTERVLNIADRVQVAAYGGRYTADRHATSHGEASRWVEWVISNRLPFPTQEDADKESWAQEVGQLATQNLIHAGKLFASTFEKKPASPANTPQQVTAPQKEDKVQTLNKALVYINSVKGNVQALRSAYMQAKKRGLLQAPVAEVEGSLVFDNTSKETLGDAITRWGTPKKEQPEPLLKNATSVNREVEVAQDTPENKTETPDTDAEVIKSDEEFLNALGGKAVVDWGAELEAVVAPQQGSDLWAKAQGSLKDKVTYKGEEMTLEEAFTRVSDLFEEAQGLAEEYIKTQDVKERAAVAEKIKNSPLKEFYVSDGVSDEKFPLKEMIPA